MASAWIKRKTWYWSFIRKTGKRYVARIPARPDGEKINKAYAKRYAETWEARYIAGLWDPDAPPPTAEVNATMTLAEYGKEWVRLLTNANAAGDARWFEKFIKPTFGAMRLGDIRPKHVRQFVQVLSATKSGNSGTLAPRTVRNIYSVLSRILARAQEDEVIAVSPCRVLRGVLPAIVDKDPVARATWVRTREEVEALLTDRRIPPDRRVLYALEFLTGARFSEIAVLRWRHWDKTLKPLTKITVAFSRDLKTGREKLTKTGTVREVPVHPVLQRVLEQWQTGGWEAHYGRAPEGDDLIVPTYNLTARDVRNNWTRHKEDCDRIGIRMTRQHDARRTFISLSIAGGARPDILEWVTHAAQRKATINQYSTLPWTTFCEAVMCLQIRLPEPEPCYPGATGHEESAKNAG